MRPPRILVADDNADLREYIQRLLASRYGVRAVGDGIAALAVAREDPPDLVLADVMMPNLDGFGLLRELRADPRTASLPVILVSARAGEESRVDGLRGGADDYLTKPFSARELLARVESHLALARLRRETERALATEVALRKQAEVELERLLLSEQAARQQAEAAVTARDEFLSVAAHELKTPITSLRGMAQLTLRRQRLQGALSAEQSEHALRLIDQQTRRLVHLLNQLLDVSRISVGKLQLETLPADISRIVDDVVVLSRLRTEVHTIVVRTPGPLLASVDGPRLEQVITNLLDNAIKYSPRGGEIQVVLNELPDGVVEIRVRDHGLGITPEHRAHVFERFYQAHREPGLAGLGLGLYVSRQIVELHGGRIDLEFPSDGGTCVVVKLPRDSD